MKRFDFAVDFQDVDAAGIVFFGVYFTYAHKAMEAFFGDLDGGYPKLIVGDRVGMPAVHVEADFRAPLRYGDRFCVEVATERIGQRSAVLSYHFYKEPRHGCVCRMLHTIVLSDLDQMKSTDMPAGVRALLEAHQLAPEST